VGNAAEKTSLGSPAEKTSKICKTKGKAGLTTERQAFNCTLSMRFQWSGGFAAGFSLPTKEFVKTLWLASVSPRRLPTHL